MRGVLPVITGASQALTMSQARRLGVLGLCRHCCGNTDID